MTFCIDIRAGQKSRSFLDLFAVVRKSYELRKSYESDGTVVNTGVLNGGIRRHELKLHRPTQWIICLLHFKELPLLHLFERKSSGPSSYTGDIGRNLKSCEKLPLVSFNSIECDLPGIDHTNLSCDQKYLLDICTAIGVGSSDLAKRQPGTLNLARCLTNNCKMNFDTLYINIKPIK
ncbi:hypothetical protein AVEN_227552-1 [Araneus ventricosus]|uniref:Uncharacterized protein n=1 Tax=Araneus ventricosus TaxID=182803 RepID=A0A4Y2C4G7_ARAVE|nr:hypothetical protein AVEN_227552-1 [Araneus ventricosus]